MNELARAIVLICQILERGGVDDDQDNVKELRAIYLTLLRRSESASLYHLTPRGDDNMRAYDLRDEKEKSVLFPPTEPPALPQKIEGLR